MRNRRGLAVAAMLVLAVAGCRREAPAPAGTRYPLRGHAVAVDPARRSITVAHEEIPGFMPAMTMEYVVLPKDAPLLAEVRPGDEVSASLVVADSRYWLEDLVVVKKATRLPGSPAAPPAPEAKPGEALPDVALVDQDGRPFRLSQLHGKAYAVTFVYTRCPLPDFCPLMMRRFAEAEALIAADPALLARTSLLTISFDSKNDTPAVLRRFGAPYQRTTPPFAHWRLATGKDQAIRRLGGALELEYMEETASFTHNLRTAVVDPAGRLRRLFRGNDWRAEDLVGALRAAAAG